MKNARSLEIGTGLFVLLGFAALAFLTTQLPGTSLKLGGDDGGYTRHGASSTTSAISSRARR